MGKAIQIAKPDNSGHLSIEQENAVDLLLQGLPDGEVAEAVNVTRQTVWTWRKEHPAFIAELNRRREAVWGSQTERLRGLVRKAVDILEEDLTAEDMRLRQAAAVHVLRSVALYGSDLSPRGRMTAEDVEADIRTDKIIDGLGRF